MKKTVSIKHKLLLFISLFVLSLQQSLAFKDTVIKTTTSNRWIFSASYGSGIPLGDLAAYDPKNISGPAKNGTCFKLQCNYFFHKFFGVAVNYINAINPGKTVSAGEAFAGSSGGGLGKPSSTTSSYNYSTSDWRNSNFMIGPCIRFSKGPLEIKFGVFAGYQFAQTPITSITGTGFNFYFFTGVTTDYTFSNVQEKMSSNNFVFGEGLEINLKRKRKVGIILNLDLYHSQAKYTGNYIYDYSEQGSIPQHFNMSNTFVKQITMAFFTAGLTYEIR